MSVVTSQRRTFLGLYEALAPHLRTDPALPERIRRLLAADRRLGARDRRLYRELLFTAVRFLPWVESSLASDPEEGAALVAWLASETPDTHRYRSGLLDDRPPVPETLAERAAHLGCSTESLLPPWFATACRTALSPDDLEALHRRAPLWLRLQTDDPEAVEAELEAEGWTVTPSGVLPDAVRVIAMGGAEGDLTRTEAWRRGAFEIQDLGSQLVLATLAVAEGEVWLDACAGAGGKTLQLARRVGATGRVDATDPRGAALEELERRARRAGIDRIRILADGKPRPHRGGPDAPPPHAPGVGGTAGRAGEAHYDGVLVDAPCSGTGTWRRAPHLKWTTRAEDPARHAGRQAAILDEAAPRVRTGGRLVYATCSLCATENEAVAEAFLARHEEFRPLAPDRDFGAEAAGPGLAIRPALHDTDGFFVAVFERAGQPE